MNDTQAIALLLGSLSATAAYVQLKEIVSSTQIRKAKLEDVIPALGRALSSWIAFLAIVAIIGVPFGLLGLFFVGDRPSWHYLPLLLFCSAFLPLSVFSDSLEKSGRAKQVNRGVRKGKRPQGVE